MRTQSGRIINYAHANTVGIFYIYIITYVYVCIRVHMYG